jgi:acetate kinase
VTAEPRGGRVLVINAGSSTLKASVLAAGRDDPLAVVTVEHDHDAPPDAAAILEQALDGLGPRATDGLIGVGHRLVHGGTEFVDPIRLDAAAVADLRRLVPLAPLHLPPAIALIDAVAERLPDVEQVGAFDTAFHARRPLIDRRYPVPDEWEERFGIRRYGFHGLSVAWAVERTAALLSTPLRRLGIVVAHLGAGSSVSAVAGGRSVHTSMGYTPLEGLMMATRSGSIDPAAVIAAIRAGRAVDDVEADLRDRSGLRGVGGTADMRELVERARDGDQPAQLAIDLFVDRAAAAVGAAATRLPALDAIVFTGGIGEHASSVRAAIVERLAVLAAGRRRGRPGSGDSVLSVRGARPAIVRVVAREDLVIARATRAVIARSSRGGGPRRVSGSGRPARSGARSRRPARPRPGR